MQEQPRTSGTATMENSMYGNLDAVVLKSTDSFEEKNNMFVKSKKNAKLSAYAED
jgi:hypothetical protein|tara:strand:- start:1083 stop:1247 length:165 start_codon:yes stop_codon:yes gene_type:complete